VPAELLPAKPGELPKLYPDKYLHLPAVEFVAAPANWERLWLKRLIDVVGSIILMVVLSPLMLAIAAAVKVAEPSLPVLYPWRVVGWHGRRFTGYKFRTMVENADELKPTLQSQNEMVGPTFKMQDDPRVTRLGRFLRKYSLDELPQFWSVLKGDMSLVGPRPAFLSEVERYQFWHKRRLSVRPGITCLWQVRGRQRIYQFDDWVRMDLEYIDRWSLGLDLAILLRTIPQVFRGTGV
jgi:lipopolysaccharide/colanic/teichoic acid biosynthesis glycosyltransferase